MGVDSGRGHVSEHRRDHRVLVDALRLDGRHNVRAAYRAVLLSARARSARRTVPAPGSVRRAGRRGGPGAVRHGLPPGPGRQAGENRARGAAGGEKGRCGTGKKAGRCRTGQKGRQVRAGEKAGRCGTGSGRPFVSREKVPKGPAGPAPSPSRQQGRAGKKGKGGFPFFPALGVPGAFAGDADGAGAAGPRDVRRGQSRRCGVSPKRDAPKGHRAAKKGGRAPPGGWGFGGGGLGRGGAGGGGGFKG